MRFFFPLLFAAMACPAAATSLVVPDSLPALTGDLQVDLRMAGETAPDRFFGREGRRSPALAFAMSAALPGLGQAYNGSWVRAAVALGLEAGLWAGHFTWKAQGREGEEAFQAFAHQEWSPYRYADWLNAYPGAGDEIDLTPVEGIDFQRPEQWSGDEWARVLGFFQDIRATERITRYVNADGTGSGATFSHVLPDFGEQQYYELIGKYFQYGPGWSDWCADYPNPEENPECFSIEGQEDRDEFATKTDLFFAYARDHAEANTLLRRASRAVSFVLANHVLAAVDAALTARLHNRGLELDAGVDLRPGADGAATPMASLRVQF